MKKIIFIPILSLILLWLFKQNSFASKHNFTAEITRQYFVQEDNTTKVIITETVTNHSSSLYIPKGTKKTFNIFAIEINNPNNKELLEKSIQTAKITYNGHPIDYSTKVSHDKAVLTIQYPVDLTPNHSIAFQLEYTNYMMIEVNGGLKDFFLNGFADNISFTDYNTQFIYQTQLYIPKTFGKENFIFPENVSKFEDKKHYIYTINQEDLIGNYVWIQFGDKQYYQFQIIQNINASESLNTGNKNHYEIVIPRDIDEWKVKQTIYYTKISPEPEWIKEDDEGNLLASFSIRTNLDTQIILEGYASVEIKDVEDTNDFGALDDVNKNEMQRYLNEAKYWEVNNPVIQNQAKLIQGNKQDIYSIVKDTYNFVISKIDYSEVKRYGLNERQGALQTLNGGAAVCMEYSDLFLTLSRAIGVPTRAAFGYGYDPKIDSTAQEPHQWVQIYAPRLGKWISVDVTWGETGPSIIGGDLNHFYTHIATISPNNPPGISSIGFGDLNLSPSEYKISIVQEIPETELLTSNDLLMKYLYKEQNYKNTVSEVVESKFNALMENIKNGEKLDLPQIILLVTILFIGMVLSLIVLKAVITVTEQLLRQIKNKYV